MNWEKRYKEPKAGDRVRLLNTNLGCDGRGTCCHNHGFIVGNDVTIIEIDRSLGRVCLKHPLREGSCNFPIECIWGLK